MSRKEENGNMETRATSELCSNSLPRRLGGDGRVECWPRDMRKILSAKAGNMAIPFQSEAKRKAHGGWPIKTESVDRYGRREKRTIRKRAGSKSEESVKEGPSE